MINGVCRDVCNEADYLERSRRISKEEEEAKMVMQRKQGKEKQEKREGTERSRRWRWKT